MNEVVANFTSNGIPLDGIWSDIAYLDLLRVFSLDENTDFWTINSTLTDWRQNGLHWVPTVMPWLIQDDDWNLYTALLNEAGAVSMDP